MLYSKLYFIERKAVLRPNTDLVLNVRNANRTLDVKKAWRWRDVYADCSKAHLDSSEPRVEGGRSARAPGNRGSRDRPPGFAS